jgi:hypothetical protein
LRVLRPRGRGEPPFEEFDLAKVSLECPGHFDLFCGNLGFGVETGQSFGLPFSTFSDLK